MTTLIRDLLRANRGAITKLIPLARKLAYSVPPPGERNAQLREFAECIWLAQYARDIDAIRVNWHDACEPADFGDCEPMAEGTYYHDVLMFDDFEGDNIDCLGGIIIPHKSEAADRAMFEAQLANENRTAITRAILRRALAGLPE